MTAGAPEVLAVVPARGGSKGIPRKNLALLGGRPLLAWTVVAAQAAQAVTRVVVSTDDDAIAAAAVEAGADVPFLRSAALAGDDVHSVHVVLDALRRLDAAEGYRPDVVVMLLPTSPFRISAHIDGAVELLHRRRPPSVVSVRRLDCYVTNLRHVDAGGTLRPVVAADDHNQQRQGLEPLFAVNGSIYAARPAVLAEHCGFHVAGALAYEMPADASLDVNHPADLDRARRHLRDLAPAAAAAAATATATAATTTGA